MSWLSCQIIFERWTFFLNILACIYSMVYQLMKIADENSDGTPSQTWKRPKKRDFHKRWSSQLRRRLDKSWWSSGNVEEPMGSSTTKIYGQVRHQTNFKAKQSAKEGWNNRRGLDKVQYYSIPSMKFRIRRLSWKQHVLNYANDLISTIKVKTTARASRRSLNIQQRTAKLENKCNKHFVLGRNARNQMAGTHRRSLIYRQPFHQWAKDNSWTIRSIVGYYWQRCSIGYQEGNLEE